MDPSVWRKVNEIFDAALDLPTAERAAYVDGASAGDDEIKCEAMNLLAGFKAADSFLEAPAALTHAPDFDEAMTGAHVGPYRLVKKLGAGGMGTVYLAVRDDEVFEKRVAVKLVRKGMDTENVLARFHNERQILATLDHPNIARLLDGGTTPDGNPYLVMEYISGVPLHHYCISHKLKLRARLRLFRDVCAAVHFAHQHLVIHRDLKPHNILVTKSGVPKLLDFGIAKLMSPEPSLHKTSRTVEGGGPMTPKYAAPEQLAGEAISTAADIYALGVLLYELLTGVSPYGQVMNQKELETAVLEKAPRKPSEAVFGILKPDFQFQLDANAKTVTNEPMSEAQAELVNVRNKRRMKRLKRLSRILKGDLDNIILMALRKDPVRRYGSVEQFSEDIRRYLVGQAVIARKETWGYLLGKFFRRNFLPVASCVVLVLILLGFLVETTFHRDQMQAERDKAKEVAMLLVDFYTSVDPTRNPGKPLTTRDLLQANVPRLERALAGQPETLALMIHTIGAAYNNMGLYEESGPLLEKALMLRRQVLGDDPAVAETLEELAYQRYQVDRPMEAAEFGRDALQILDVCVGEHDPRTVSLVGKLALLYRFNLEEGQALTGLLKRGESLTHQLRNTSFMRGDASEAAAGLRVTLAYLAMARDDLVLAREHLDTGYRALIRLKDPRSPVAVFALKNSILLHQLQEQHGPAEQQTAYLLSLQRSLLHERHPSLAQTLLDLGGFREREGDYRGAKVFYEEALAIRRDHFPPAHSDRLDAGLRLAVTLAETDDYQRASSLLQEVIRHGESDFGDPFAQIEPLFYMGMSVLDQGREQEAEKHLHQGLNLLLSEAVVEGADHADFYRELGRVQLQRGRLAEAESWFERSIAILGGLGDAGADRLPPALAGLARVRIGRGDLVGGELLLAQAYDGYCRTQPKADPHGRIAAEIGATLVQQGKNREAKTWVDRAVDILIRERGVDDPLTRRVLKQQRDLAAGGHH